MADSMIFYRSFRDAIKKCNAEDAIIAFDAILDYGLDGIEPEDLEGIPAIIFDLVKPQIDANDKRRINGRKGGRPAHDEETEDEETEKPMVIETENHRLSGEKTIGYADGKPNVNVNDNDNENLNDNPNENSNEDPNVNENVKRKTREPKHAHGEYKHVNLTDRELEKLNNDFGEAETLEAITFLDEYIEEKHYKSQSHYLAMRRWVFQAVKERREKDRPRGYRDGPGKNGSIANEWSIALQEAEDDKDGCRKGFDDPGG